MSGSISGTVIDAATLHAVAGAQISVHFLGAVGQEWRAVQRDLSDAAGGFFFSDLEAGVWRITCRPPFGPEVEVSTRVHDDALTSLEIEIEGDVVSGGGGTAVADLGRIRGWVVEATTGAPVENASVTIAEAAGPAPDIAALTNAAGAFAFDALPAGNLILEARSPAGGSGRAAATLAAGDEVEVTIEV